MTTGLRRDCGITYEIDQVGYDSLFPDGLKTGIFRVRHWTELNPGNPSVGLSWVDTGVEVERLEVVTS